MESWSLRSCIPPLIRPVPIDPEGHSGPTRGQAGGPRWRRTSPGLYVPSAVARNQVEQRILEESGRLPPSGAVTGWAALRLYGAGYFDGLAADLSELPVPVVIPQGVALRGTPGIEVHRERLANAERILCHGVPVTSPERAAFDAARRADGLRAAVVVLDMALSSGVTNRQVLATYLRGKAGWPGVRLVAKALALANSRCMSPQESALRLIWLLDAGLPPVRCNWPVADQSGVFIGRPDLLCEDVAVVGEFDGAHHRSRSRHRDDLRRDDLFRSVGFEPFRVVGADLSDVPLVMDRILATIDRAARGGAPRTWRLQASPRPVT